ncbi:MAG TPA: cupredoxin domain-containing protein [Nitrospiria bacterium]|nr:cupredoxin domain-containing protein [Nitrospiria bacterium]
MRFGTLLLITALVVFPASVSSADGEPVLKTTIRGQRFIPAEIHIKGNTPFVLQVSNEDSIPVEFESADLNKEKIVPPGKTIEMKFKGLPPGSYEFFSDFGPKDLKGKIIVE